MPRTLRYRLQTVGGSIDALIDLGAELSLISAAAVQVRGIQIEPLEEPLYIVLADQSQVQATYCVPALPLSRSSWSDEMICVVAPSLSEQLFLGRDWLCRWNPVID